MKVCFSDALSAIEIEPGTVQINFTYLCRHIKYTPVKFPTKILAREQQKNQ
jgi:hypothetical protein